MKNAKKLKNMNTFKVGDFCPKTIEYCKQFWEEKNYIEKGNIS